MSHVATRSLLRPLLLLTALWCPGCFPSAPAQQIARYSSANDLPDAPGRNSGLFQTPGQAVDPQGSASIGGEVLDINGDPVLNATITLVEQGQAERSVTSAGDGRFLFSGLGAGKYTVTIHSPGLETFVASDIILRAGDKHELPHLSLPLAAVNTDVQVTVTQVEIAQEQIKLQEEQRVFGVLPNFYTSYVWNAAPLNARQKFGLAIHSITDPVDFVVTGAVAGVQQGLDSFHDYHQGAKGYAKRYGASYADGAISRIIGSAVLPSILHQDPRYFYKGSGSKTARAWHAMSSAVITRRDSGSLEPNYSHVGGSFIGGAIANAYHPAANRGINLTLRNSLIDTAGNMLNNLLREFVLRDLTPTVPAYATGQPKDEEAKTPPRISPAPGRK